MDNQKIAKNKQMTRLVSEPFTAIIDQLIAEDPGLVDTFAIMVNPEIHQAIEQSRKEYQEGKAIHVEEIIKPL